MKKAAFGNVAPARAAAFEILLTIERDAGRSDELLHRPSVNKLSLADRNLATNLVMGTLRWQIALDADIATFLARPNVKLDPAVRVALRLGAFQVLYLDRVPVYAAIGESVELAKHAGNRFLAGMVNAILRKIAAKRDRQETVAVTSAKDLANVYAHPQWLVERWIANFGFAAAKAICEYDQEPSAASIRLLAKHSEEELHREGIELAPGSFLTNVRRVVRGDASSAQVFRNGLIRIQDEGSQLVAELAGHGGRILDACAAPGGKTAILAERNPDAKITACDVSRRRIEEMQRLFHGNAFMAGVEYVTADIAKMNLKQAFDLILCDAPCSGTGTLARNPEIRHRLAAEELNRQHEKQVSILSSLMRSVQGGGRLLYSTCSLEPEENEGVIRACLEGQGDFEIISMEKEIDRLRDEGVLSHESAAQLRQTALTNGCLRTLPGVHKCDGFFARLLVKRA